MSTFYLIFLVFDIDDGRLDQQQPDTLPQKLALVRGLGRYLLLYDKCSISLQYWDTFKRSR
jgi:hypothetical protein